MKISKLPKKNRSLFYFWRGYLLFMILFLGCMVPFFLKALWVLEENVETNTYQNVENGMEILDQEITSLTTAVIELRSFQYFTYIRSLENDYQSSDYYVFREMKEKLNDSTKLLSFARNPMMCFQNGVIIFEDTVYAIEAQNSYNKFHGQNYGRLEDWIKELTLMDYEYTFLAADSFYNTTDGYFTGLPYVHVYKRANQRGNPVFITIFPVDTLLNLCGLDELRNIADITIVNPATNEVLYENGIHVTGRISNIETVSKNANLAVSVSIPLSYFFGQLTDLIVMAFIYLVVFLVVAIGVSVVFAYKNSRPVKGIISILDKYTKDPHDDKAAPYEYIEQSITEIGNSARHYEVQHEKLSQEVAHWLMREQILNGLDGKQLEEFLQGHENFPLPFRLLVIHLSHAEWNILSTEVKELLIQEKIAFPFFSKIKPNYFMLLCDDNRDCNVWRETLGRFMTIANEKWECDCVISVSMEHSSLLDLKELYQLTRSNMKYFGERKLILQDEMEEDSGNGLRDLNLLENIRLTDMILNGNETEATDLIRSQWDKVRGSYKDSVVEQLFFMQSAVLNSIADRLRHDERMTALSVDDNIASIEVRIVGFVKELCSLVVKRKEENKNDVPRQIVEYMREHFSDPEFYMTTLVEEFGLSDKTIAKAIRSYQNKTFSGYLEELRLQKALTLLDDTRLNIGYIANASGFSSENTFFKVFKRKYGVSPSNYRNNKQMMSEAQE